MTPRLSGTTIPENRFSHTVWISGTLFTLDFTHLTRLHRSNHPETYPQAIPRSTTVPVEVDRRGGQLRNALVNTRFQLVHRVDPDRTKKGALHHKEGAFNQIEPRPILKRMNEFEAPGSRCQPCHECLLPLCYEWLSSTRWMIAS